MNNQKRQRQSCRNRHCRPSGRTGATAVEVSIVAPIFFFTIFGAIEFSRVAMLRNLAQDASYEAARVCMVDGATTEEANEKANEVLALLAARGAEISINDGNGLAQTSDTIKVSVEIPLNQNSFVLPWLFASHSIRASTELRTERYNGDYQD